MMTDDYIAAVLEKYQIMAKHDAKRAIICLNQSKRRTIKAIEQCEKEITQYKKYYSEIELLIKKLDK